MKKHIKSLPPMLKLKSNITYLASLLVCTWLMFYMSCAYANAAININASSKEFTISLKANPTTGYQWLLEPYNKKLLKCKNKVYTPNNRLIGAGGITDFNFTVNNAKKTFSTTIKFIYKRPWEKNIIAQQKTYIINYSANQ